MDATAAPRFEQGPPPPPSWTPKLRLLPGMRLITWLFSVATRAVLLAILAGVFGFLVLFAYFLVGRTWCAPVILSAGHERVVQARREWMEESLKVADLDSRISVLHRQLLEAENGAELARTIAAAEAQALREDAAQNALEIEVGRAAIARGTAEHREATSLLARIGKLPDPEANFEKGLVNRARFLTDMLARTDLSIRAAELDTNLAEAAARLAALERRRARLRAAAALGEGKPGQERLGHEELQHVSVWNKATLDLRTGADEMRRLRRDAEQLEALRAELLRGLRPLAESPLLAAARAPVAVVFVAYGNGAAFKPGQPVFRCRLGLLLCSPIGTIGPVVDGEVSLPHPLFRRAVRGSFRSVEAMAEPQAAQDALLFSAPPLFF